MYLWNLNLVRKKKFIKCRSLPLNLGNYTKINQLLGNFFLNFHKFQFSPPHFLLPSGKHNSANFSGFGGENRRLAAFVLEIKEQLNLFQLLSQWSKMFSFIPTWSYSLYCSSYIHAKWIRNRVFWSDPFFSTGSNPATESVLTPGSWSPIQSLLIQLLRLLKRIRSEHSFAIIHTYH